MSGGMPAQGAGVEGAPVTPGKQKQKRGEGSAIDDLVRELRDDWNLAIAPRDLVHSPGLYNNSTGDALYRKIKSLYWDVESRETLYKVIKECESDFAGPLSGHSPQRRTEYVLQKLHDPAWFASNRVHQSLLHANASSSTRTPSSLHLGPHWLRRVDSGADTEVGSTPTSPLRNPTPLSLPPGRRSLQRVDSRADTEAPSTPTSPLARKSMASTQNTTPTSTRDSSPTRRSFPSVSATTNPSYTHSVTQSAGDEEFGSSFRESQVVDHRADLHHTAYDTHVSRSNPPAFATSPKQTNTKRKRSDRTEASPGTPSKRYREQPVLSPGTSRKVFSPHWQLNNLAKDGLGVDPITDPDEFWKDILTAREDSSTCVLRGAISLNSTNKGPLMQTKLDPVRWENNSSRAQRHFGADRFLVLEAQSFTRNLPRHIGSSIGQDENRSAVLEEWLVAPKYFMGRKWFVFFVEDIDEDKRKKKARGKKVAGVNTPIREIWLFATEGIGIDKPTSLFKLLDWMFPFRENAGQAVCKSYARFLLSIKQSTPSINFKPSQIRWVNDILANGEPEDTRFEDPAFRGKRRKHWDVDEVMTDGCATISVGAARLILKLLEIRDLPAAFQGRINGAKGMWSISAPYETSDPDHLAIWIEIRPSQLKVKPRKQDLDDAQCEEDRWNFNVKGYSKSPRVSHLHKDFLPVFEDRNVPSENIIDIVREGVQPSVEELKEMMDDPAKLVIWRQRYYPTMDEHRMFDKPGMPAEPSKKALLFAEKAGYMPQDHVILADAFERMIEAHIQRIRYHHHFSCLKSASFLGLADPYGVLEPGEIHVALSRPLEDEMTKEKFHTFAGNNVLVGRDPTLRGSDIQKVRCICHPKLAHLKDVAIFPTRGQVPLAAKLQGGDYDGDRFWICAEERLVEPFMNAPVLEQRGIDFFGIEQEKRSLGEIINPENFGTDEHATAFMRVVLPIACRDKTLGMVTNYCNDLSYSRRNGKGLWDADVGLVADLHDLVIDAEKNGYLYGATEFANFRHDNGLPDQLGRREYEANLKASKLRSDVEYNDETKLLTILAKKPQSESNYIMDRVIFEEVNPPFLAYLQDLQKDVMVPAEISTSDPDLEFQLIQFEAKAHLKLPIDLGKEKRALEKRLQETMKIWTRTWRVDPASHDDVLSQCIDDYNGIQPADKDNPYWSMAMASSAPSLWDCFKLAVFARKYYASKKKAIFWIARDTVCQVKAQSTNGKRNLGRIQEVLKAVKPKIWRRADAFNALPVPQIEDSDYEGDDDSLFEFDL